MPPKRTVQSGPDEPEQSHGHEQEKEMVHLEYCSCQAHTHTHEKNKVLPSSNIRRARTQFPLLALSRIVCDILPPALNLKWTR